MFMPPYMPVCLFQWKRKARSLNVINAVSMVLGEALRQVKISLIL